MSVLETWYAVPSRIQVVYRYLLSRRGQRASEDALLAALTPDSLLSTRPVASQDEEDDEVELVVRSGRQPKKRGMLLGVLEECERMGLTQVEGKEISLHPDLPEVARNPEVGPQVLRSTLMTLFTGKRASGAGDLVTENHILLRLIAWYLAQDPHDAPKNWPEFQERLLDQVGESRLGMTNNGDYGQFNDWVTYFRLAWNHNFRKAEALNPDPTPFVRASLPALFGSVGTRIPIARVERDLAVLCPVFEGGFIRTEIEALIRDKVESRADRVLSRSTAMAWLRLREEGTVEFESGAADAEVYLLPDGPGMVRCAAITWRNPTQEN